MLLHFVPCRLLIYMKFSVFYVWLNLNLLFFLCLADWEMITRQCNQHLGFSHVLYVKLTLLQVRASLFMLVQSSPPAQSPGKGLSFVLVAVTRRMPWKENAQVELKWHNFLILSHILSPLIFFFFVNQISLGQAIV